MARSFSQEPRSDSHKIGEARYRMSHLPSTTAMARTLLLAGILLAVTVLAARSFFPAFAQTVPDETTDTLVIRNFPENSEDAVATYSAMDPEGEMVDWEIVPSGETDAVSPDADVFEVSDQGELTFKNTPDFESPTSSTAGQGGTSLEDQNRYVVQVRASDPDNNTHTITVTVYVRNVEEAGTVEFGTIQPRQGIGLVATLTDDDDITTATTTWKWERSLDGSTDWTEATTTTEKLASEEDTETSTYAPVKDDVDHYLRVTVSYTDQEGPRKMSEPKVTANKVGASLVNTAPYFVYTATGEIPDGADEEVEDKIPDGETLVREIAENSDEDEDVGEPVKAEDDNGDNLTYAFDTTAAPNDKTDAVTVTVPDANGATFNIDRSTGQITVGADTELNFEGTKTYRVTVTATDPFGLFDELDVVIRVTNVQENPSIDSGPANILQTEITYDDSDAIIRNQATTTSDGNAVLSTFADTDGAIILATYTATDDEDSDARLLEWSLTGSHANVVVICDEDETTSENCGIAGVKDNDNNPTETSSVVLWLTELPDYTAPANSNNSFVLKLTVTDRTRPTAKTDTMNVVIRIINVDEPGTVMFSHDQPEVNTSIRADLTDPDVKRGTVTYRWYYLDTPAEVRHTGQTFTPRNTPSANPPINDVGEELRVVASYNDAHGDGKTAEATLTRTVQDEDTDNRTPVFMQNGATTTTSVTLSFRENETPTTLGLSAANVTVDDDDTVLVYTLDSNNDHASFRIPDRNTLRIVPAQGTAFEFDYEKKKKYTLDIRVTDPSDEDDVQRVVVDITDFQDPPRAPSTGTEVSYPEVKNSVPNTDVVHTYTTTDDDDRRIGGGRQLTWRISEDTDGANTHSAFFSITERGALSFKSPPDFETADTSAPADDIYLVKLEVFDNGDVNGDDVKSTDVPVTVTVTNVDEPGIVTFDTLQPLEKMAFTAELADDDIINTTATTTWKWERSDNGTSNWSLATTTVESPVGVNDVSDTMYTPVADDVGKFLRVTVSYRDNEDTDRLNPEKMSVPQVTANAVARNLVNDPPFFVYTADDEIPEGKKLGDKIDDDSATSTVVRKVAENSAEDTVVGAAIKADDEDRDINNNKDVLTYAFDTDHDATDDDVTNAVTVTLPDGPTFDIDRTTGQITVGANSKLDYEGTERSYTLAVTATDPSGAYDVIGVMVEVTNIEENPEIEGAAEISLTEVIDPGAATPMATTTIDDGAPVAISAVNEDGDAATTPRGALPLASFTATDDEDDADTRVAEALKWTLSGPDVDRFILFGESDSAGVRITDNVDARGIEDIVSTNTTTSTVQLLLKELPDYEAPANSNNTYRVTLTVTDTTHPEGLTDTHDVTVEVTNLDEKGEVKILNRQPEVGVPIKAELSDPDGSINIMGWQWVTADLSLSEGDRVTQANIESAARLWMNIAGATSDTYTPVSGDATKLLAAVVTYRDAANKDNPFTHDTDESEISATTTADYTVKGADNNNQAPVFPDQDDNTPGDQSDRATRSILESAGTGDPVGDHIPARDTDGSGGTDVDVLTYTLGGPDAALFKVDQLDANASPATFGGQIRVGAGTKFDFETKSTYTVTVIATDPSGASDTITVTINIQNVNEAPTVEMVEQLRLTGDTSPSIAENQTGTVTTFRATGPGSDTGTWSLTGADASSFAISGGVLSVPSALNFESPSDANRDRVYEVTVTVQAGTMSRSLDARVTVTDVDEPGTVNLSSPGNEVKVGVQLTAELDEGDEEVVNGWQWSSGPSNTGPWTSISGETNNTYTPVDGDVGNFLRVTVNYTDAIHGLDSLSAVTASAVEAAVAGTSGSVSLSPAGGLTSGDSVTATLTDPDNPVSLNWTWEISANGSTNWSTAPGAVSSSGLTSTYTTTILEVGNFLRASVTYNDDSGTGQTAGPTTTTNAVQAGTQQAHRYDLNSNGSIERDEVLEAITDFLFGETPPGGGPATTRDEVLELIALFLFG